MNEPTTKKPDHEGCFRVEYEPGKWCWMITYVEFRNVMFQCQRWIQKKDGHHAMFDQVYKLKDGYRYIEVFPPESEV